MNLTLALVMNPMEKVLPAVDTSFGFMLAAQARGHRVLHVLPSDVSVEGDRVILSGQRLEVFDQKDPFYRVIETVRVDATECGAIFIRTDPPFDSAYLNTTLLLSLAEERGVRIVNSARGLREANEHLYALYFPEVCPETVVSAAAADILAFVDRVGGSAIGKPIDGHAGFGVVRLEKGDSNLKPLIDLLTKEATEPIVVQRFLPEVARGDKRLLLIDGEIRGAVLRVPRPDDHRGNVHVGGRAEPCEVTASDRAIEAAMGERLRRDGLTFVGIDVIGDKLIEVNVTSPTLIRELRDLGGPDLGAEIIASVEAAPSTTLR